MKEDNTKENDSKSGSQPNPFGRKPPPEKTPQERRDNINMIAASQFAYTLTIGTLLFGFAGMWLGNKLGGAPWNMLLMLLFGSLAFVGEVYRMYIMFTPKKPKDDGAKRDTKQGADKDGAKPDANNGAKPDASGNGFKSHGDASKPDVPNGNADQDCGCGDD